MECGPEVGGLPEEGSGIYTGTHTSTRSTILGHHGPGRSALLVSFTSDKDTMAGTGHQNTMGEFSPLAALGRRTPVRRRRRTRPVIPLQTDALTGAHRRLY